MKKLLALVIAFAGCTDTLSTDTSALESPLHWMVGTWDCTGTYKDAGPFVAHSASGVYVGVDVEGQANSIHTSYVEAPGGIEPAVNVDETWSIGFLSDSSGGVVTSIATSLTGGMVSAGAGSLVGPAKSGVVLGAFATSAGVMAMPDGTHRAWKHGLSKLPNPTRLVGDWAIETMPGSGILAVYLNTTCLLRPSQE